MYRIILCCIKGFLKVFNFEVVVRNLRYFARDRTYIYMRHDCMHHIYIYIYNFCVEVFEKTISCTEMIDPSFES